MRKRRKQRQPISEQAKKAIQRKKEIDCIRQEVINVWQSIGTLVFCTFEELAMMLDLPNTDYVKEGFDTIKEEPSFFVRCKGREIYLDYIPF